MDDKANGTFVLFEVDTILGNRYKIQGHLHSFRKVKFL